MKLYMPKYLKLIIFSIFINNSIKKNIIAFGDRRGFDLLIIQDTIYLMNENLNKKCIWFSKDVNS